MVDQPIGLEETDDGLWTIYFNTGLLATFDQQDYVIRGCGPTCYPCTWTLVLPIIPAVQST
jgi:hypothetical protein